MTWDQWFHAKGLQALQKAIQLPTKVLERTWQPTPADERAAWLLYTEMRTRIATQPLHYRSGDEATALKSLYDLFEFTRDILRKRETPCVHFAIISVFVVNIIIRPFTAYWHKRKEAGLLANEDVRRDFRAQLPVLQDTLRHFQTFLGWLAEGDTFVPESESGYERIRDADPYPLGDAITFDRLLLLSETAGNEILEKEQLEIHQRRNTVLQRAGLSNLVGLAISGGGIRSATIALGAVQKLAEEKMLREVDLLSTVSGGGYFGAFLSSYLNTDNPAIGPAAEALPFRRDDLCESAPLRHLRNHSKYLIEGGLIDRLRVIGQALYGILMNVLIVVTAVLVWALLEDFLQGNQIRAAIAGDPARALPIWIVLLFAVMGLVALLLTVFQNLGRLGPALARVREGFEKLSGWGLLVTLIAGWFALQPWLLAGFHRLVGEARDWVMMLTSLAAVAWATPAGLGALAVVLRRWPTVRRFLVPLFWVSGPLAFLLLYLALTRALAVYGGLWLGDTRHLDRFTLSVVAAALVIYCLLFLNINFTSPHRYYRDQLASTYLLQHVAGATPATQKVEPQKLSGLSKHGKAPYHLINATLNMPASMNPELRGRDSDFFVFSKHWCGSPLLGYRRTAEWEAMDGHLDLGTAVAISGAAAAPQMGMTSIRGARFWMAILNVRLNYWLRRPDVGVLPAWVVNVFGGPGALYLLREIFGRVDMHTKYVNVSDGGHLENLGIYELLRRRCKFIIAIDGEQDPGISCASLIKLSRFAWIDFGTKIELDLSELRPAETGYGKAHFVLGEIKYPNGAQGFLLYLKSSLTGNEPEYVLEYRCRFKDFPHQSTGDQLFEEDQFEAYRGLGYHLAEDLFRSELIGLTKPADVPAWFQRLATSLLVRK